MNKFPTAPLKTTTMPPGIPYIIGNEAAERFCFYGMKTILVVFMTQYLMGLNGQKSVMTDVQAKEIYHTWVFAVYFLPLFGAIISDVFWGKYWTIFNLSLVYCAGNVVLAVDDTRNGLLLGLTLIAIGSGGIKPCVSANVGDQFGSSNQHLLTKAFGWFYFSVNFGSFFSTLLTPWLLERYGPHVAFGIPGGLMLLATWIFWLGRYKFAHIPPAGWGFIKETFSVEGLQTIARLIPIYLCVAMFWSLWDQTGSAWVLQAEKMDRHWLGINWLSSQVQAANPILVLIFVPLLAYQVYPAINKVFTLTPLRKISIGLFLTVPTFVIPAWVESQITKGLQPSIAWQFLDYVIISAAEVMVSVTALEFSYTQSPKKMKSLIMSLYLLSIALGNAFTAVINHFIQNKDGTSKLAGGDYYMFFAATMFVTALIFILVALFYRGKTYLQEESKT